MYCCFLFFLGLSVFYLFILSELYFLFFYFPFLGFFILLSFCSSCSDNTVFSTQLANADITYTGDGLTPKLDEASEEDEVATPVKNAKKAGPVMRFLAGFIPFL